MYKVLVTGGRGYLGARLCSYLSSLPDFAVTALSRSSSPMLQLPTVPVFAADLSESALLEAACSGMDSVVHLAGLNDADCKRDPIQASEVNVLGTKRLVEAARKMGVRRFLFISTAHVYGAPLTGLVSESTVPRPVSVYAGSKLAAENAIREMRGSQGIILRLSNVCGAPLDGGADCWSLLVNNLAREVVEKRTISLLSSGEQFRNFLSMDDFLRSIVHFLKLDPKQVVPAVLNLGGAESISVLKMAERIQARANALFGYLPTLSRSPSTAVNDASPLNYSIDLLLRTGFVPTQDLDAAIDETLNFCAHTRSLPR